MTPQDVAIVALNLVSLAILSWSAASLYAAGAHRGTFGRLLLGACILAGAAAVSVVVWVAGGVILDAVRGVS